MSSSAALAANAGTSGTLWGKLLLVYANAINSQHSLRCCSEKSYLSRLRNSCSIKRRILQFFTLSGSKIFTWNIHNNRLHQWGSEFSVLSMRSEILIVKTRLCGFVLFLQLILLPSSIRFLVISVWSNLGNGTQCLEFWCQQNGCCSTQVNCRPVSL